MDLITDMVNPFPYSRGRFANMRHPAQLRRPVATAKSPSAAVSGYCCRAYFNTAGKYSLQGSQSSLPEFSHSVYEDIAYTCVQVPVEALFKTASQMACVFKASLNVGEQVSPFSRALRKSAAWCTCECS